MPKTFLNHCLEQMLDKNQIKDSDLTSSLVLNMVFGFIILLAERDCLEVISCHWLIVSRTL